jgi:hypothetical protein
MIGRQARTKVRFYIEAANRTDNQAVFAAADTMPREALA